MQAKLIAGGVIALILISVITGCVWYFKWSQAEIKVLNLNNASLTTSLASSEASVASLQSDIRNFGKNITVINEEYEAARTENNALRSKLAKHNIGYLASKKPKLVQKILNKGTADAERCFEILSGSPLTEKETAATLKSQSNSSCPSIANPNYTVKP